MSQSFPVTQVPTSVERTKMLLYRTRTDGRYDVIIHHPKTDLHKVYIAEFTLSIKGDGESLTPQQMQDFLKTPSPGMTWVIGLTTYFWRDK